jgi:hypothetical protein
LSRPQNHQRTEAPKEKLPPAKLDLLAKPSKGFIQGIRDKWTAEGFLESGREHIGKTLDAGNLPDLILDAGVAYFGARAADELARAASNGQNGATPEQLFAGIITGLVGKRLALALGGTPPVSQIAGLAILSGIGVIDIAPFVSDLLGVGPIPGIENPFAAGYSLAQQLAKQVKGK